MPIDCGGYAGADDDNAKAATREKQARVDAGAIDPQIRMNLADELLDRLVNDIGTGPALARLRLDALRIKHVLRGLESS